MAFGQDHFEGDMDWQELEFEVKSVKKVNCLTEPPTCPSTMKTLTSPPLDPTMKRPKTAASTELSPKVATMPFKDVTAARRKVPDTPNIDVSASATADAAKAKTMTAVTVVLFIFTRIVN